MAEIFSAFLNRRSESVRVMRIAFNYPPVQSLCQIGSTLTARSPQSEHRSRQSSSLNPSISAAPCNPPPANSPVFPHARQRAWALISKSSAGLRSGRIGLAAWHSGDAHTHRHARHVEDHRDLPRPA